MTRLPLSLLLIILSGCATRMIAMDDFTAPVDHDRCVQLGMVKSKATQNHAWAYAKQVPFWEIEQHCGPDVFGCVRYKTGVAYFTYSFGDEVWHHEACHVMGYSHASKLDSFWEYTYTPKYAMGHELCDSECRWRHWHKEDTERSNGR